MGRFRTLDDTDFKGKRALVRVDLNVPMVDGKVSDDTRIRATEKTIREIAGNGGRVILISHFGRPKDGPDPKYSLKPVVAAVAEAGVVGFPHPIKGQGVYAYIVLQPGEVATTEVESQLVQATRTQIGAHAKVDLFQFVPGLPKTRSGKVMRRILRKVAEGQSDQLGDVSTLADPSVVDAIKAGAKALS